MNTILVIEDNELNLKLMVDILTINGYQTLVARSGEEGMSLLATQTPDLILMDVVMPGKNGFQVTRIIARDPDMQNVTVIICTSKDQETDRVWGLRQGAHDYLVKPIDPQVLLEKIAALG